MCGISGCVSSTAGVARAGIAAQLDCQRHRGPDAAGHFASEHGAIAQNRLAVIDLSTGDPPVSGEDGTIGAVLNGEIYNYQALRERLHREGHTLRTRGDTEVLAHLAEALNPTALAQALDGMFAFAVWDTRRQRLVLGRDRLGKKPLYYWHDGTTLVFASEIKGVLAHPAVRAELDPQALSAYLTFGYVPTPHTFFRGIQSVPPAHTLALRPGGAPELTRFWQLTVPGAGPDARHLRLGLDAAAAEVRDRLDQAIRRRGVADVPVGAFLSGGIDSSAIVALMAAAGGDPIPTFTIGFDDDDGFDERPFARAVARRFGTDHHEHVVHADAVGLVEQLVALHDQPFGDSSAIPTYLLNQVARQHVTVALSGDGGDELFGGYERFAGALAIDRARHLPAPLRRGAGRLAAQLPAAGFGGRAGKLQRFSREVDRGLPWAYLNWISYVPEDWRRRLLPSDGARAGDWGQADYLQRWQSTAGAATLDRLLALNLDTYLVDDLLVKTDRMSMAHGLEVRSPFLDTELLEFAVGLAPALKIRGLSLKRVLKRAVGDLLPTEILQRPKRGFGVPLDRWFRTDLGAYTASMLGPDAHLRAHVRGDQLDALRAEHRAGASHGHALWTLLTLELFLRRHGW